jgi:7-cyano-7-deazaguanine synthase
MNRPKAVAIVSGGLDSVVMAHGLADAGFDLHVLSFDYGQRHRRELDSAEACARRLGATFDRVDVSGLAVLLKGSALTDPAVEVPEGHYAAESMRATVVPNRNAIMLAIAYGAAVADGAEVVATAVHAGDHAVYPDCRLDFVGSFANAMFYANEGFGDPRLRLVTPFLKTDKAGIVAEGHRLGVPMGETWSCYKGGELHCGKCGTCVERREAFELAGVPDPTAYED